MKMPFGKHKGKELAFIADNYPNYIMWLLKLELTDNLKKEVLAVEKIAQNRIGKYIKSSMQRQYESEYEESVKYDEDLTFWSRVSPYATYDYLLKYNKRSDVSDSDWRYLMSQISKRES